MKTKGVQESRQTFHHDKNGQSEQGPQHENNGQEDSSDIALALKTQRQDHVPEYLGELCVKKYTELARASPWADIFIQLTGMSQRQSPQTQVRSGVRNGTQNVFNGVDGLVDEDFAQRLIFVIVFASWLGSQ